MSNNDDRRESHQTWRSPGVPRLLADRYEVHDELGEGATAVTYRGTDRRLDRTVAIKILRTDVAQDPTFIQRFEREARTAASVSHGNVVDVYDFGEQDGRLYIVMQYVAGEDLKHLIAREAPLDPERIRRIAKDILAGLGAVHAVGILHRDIKSQNVLIGQDGIARVADFGIAQAQVDSGLTTAGTTVGTAAYMAPEQAQAGALTEATDIYAVGVILYEMATGLLPFDGPTPIAMMLAHIQQQVVPPSQRVPSLHVPSDLENVIMQAMAKQPADRFRSAQAMTRALEGRGGTPAFGTGQTTVVTGVPDQRTAVAPAQQRGAAQPPFPADGGTGYPPPPTANASGGERRRLGRVVGWFIILAVLAVGVFAAYSYLTADDDDDPDLPAAIQPTEEPTEEPTLAPTETPTEANENGDSPPIQPQPTQPPPEATDPPTEAPTAEPTEEPPPEAPPTQEPPTEAVPTDSPDPTSPPIEPQPPDDDADGVDNGGDDTAGQNNAEENQETVSAIELPLADWSGGSFEDDNGQLEPWLRLRADETMDTTFEAPAAQEGQSFSLVLVGVSQPEDAVGEEGTPRVEPQSRAQPQEVPLVITVNGEEFQVQDLVFTQAEQDDTSMDWTTIDVMVPENVLLGGENTLELAQAEGEESERADLLLRELWLELA